MASIPSSLVKFHHEEDLRSNLPADLFCTECAAFLRLERWTPERGTDEMSSRSSHSFHSQIEQLYRQVTQGCNLCMLILRVIIQAFPSEDKTTLIFLSVKNMLIFIQVGTDKARHTPVLKLSKRVYENGFNLTASDWIYAHRRRLCQLTSTRYALEQIKRWIGTCNEVHPLCALTAAGAVISGLPTRLLRIDNQKATLVNTDTFTDKQTYVTLSHRWPKSPGLRLLKGNEAELRAGISWNRLPVLFRDACWLSSCLNVHCLWIDALCIIQDDEHDWEVEAALMTNVYVGSFLNIVAGTSQQDQSLFSDRNPVSLSPCIIDGSQLGKKLGSEAIFAFSSGESGQIATMNTESRAWVLQECELAPRMIYVGDKEVIWECSSLIQSESSVRGINGPEETPLHGRNVRANISSFKSDHIEMTEARSISIWEGLVSKYTSRDLTFVQDRLVAISGLSQYLERTADGKLGRYYAGLWETGFESQLLWQIAWDTSLRTSASYLAPSWSWASHSSRIMYLGSPAGTRSMSSFLEQLQIEVLPSSPKAPHGQVKSGNFIALANLCEIHLQFDAHHQQLYFQVDYMDQVTKTVHPAWLPIDFSLDDPPQASKTPQTFTLLPLLCYDVNDHGLEYRRRPIARHLFTDWQIEESEDSNLPVLPRGRWRLPLEQEDHYELRALILTPVPGQKGHYRRAGVTKFERVDAIRLIQDACRRMDLAQDRYLQRVDARCGYEIKVV